MLPLYVLLVLAGVGYYVTKEAPKPRKRRWTVAQSDIPSMDNAYESKHYNKADAAFYKRGADMFERSQDPQDTGVISKNFSLNNEGRSQYVQSRLAGVDIPQTDFTHNNMVPYFGGSIRQNIRDDATHSVLENHTGVFSLQHAKREVESFGDLSENMGNPYGSTGAYQLQQERMVNGKLRANELPFEQVRVGPGLARGFESQPTGGFQQFDQREYEVRKTVDDLRVATRPKLTYESRNVDGMKTSLPGKIGDMCKNRVETFYQNDPDRYLVTTGAEIKEAQRPEEILKYQQRIDTTKEYEGGAYNPRGPKQKAEMTTIFRQELGETGVLNATLEDKGKGSNYDYGKNSILVYTNERDTTACRTYEGNVASSISAVIAPFSDLARTSIKEYSIQNPRPYGQFSRQMPEKATIYDPNDVARTTIKETLIHDPQTANLAGPQRVTVYDPDDVTRVTTRNTLAEVDKHINLSGHRKATLYDPDDPMRTTTRQTTIDSERDGNIDSKAKGGGYGTATYDPKITQRQFTSDTEYSGNVYKRDADGYKVATHDPKVTQRQFTSDNDYYGGLGGDKAQMSYDDIYNATPNLTKEMTIVNREPTKTGVKVAAGQDMKGAVDSRKTQCDTLSERGNGGGYDHISSVPPTKTMIDITKERQIYKQDDRLDMNILTAFVQNPYTHSLHSVA